MTRFRTRESSSGIEAIAVTGGFLPRSSMIADAAMLLPHLLEP